MSNPSLDGPVIRTSPMGKSLLLVVLAFIDFSYIIMSDVMYIHLSCIPNMKMIEVDSLKIKSLPLKLSNLIKS